MNEIRGEQPKDKKEEPVIKPKESESLRFNPEKPTEMQKIFLEAMKIEDIREDELKRLRVQLIKKYQDLPEEEIDTIIQSEKIQDNLEAIVKIRLEGEKRKRLYLGVIDLEPIKNLILKVQNFFKKKQ